MNQQKISNYLDIREIIGRLKETSENYDLEFTYAQVTLKPDISKINSIIQQTKKERKKIITIINNIDNTDYIHSVNHYVSILDKRLTIHQEIIHKYSKLTKIYQDYLVIADNAEKAVGDNIDLQLKIKHAMLDLEKSRLMSKGMNRDAILENINLLRNKLIYESPKIQEKVGLFADIIENIVKSLRYIDTIREAMNSDGYFVKMQSLRHETIQEIDNEEFNFSMKLFFFLLLSILLVAGQFIILTLFFMNKKRTEKLQREALDKIHKSQEIADRAKQYALDAQRSQFRLLHNFCSDFDIIITNIGCLSHLLKNEMNSHLFEITDMPFIDTQKISITRLDASVIALERWLRNYLEVYTPQDNWNKPKQEIIHITDLFDKNFTEARFFMHEKNHLLGILHGDIPCTVLCDTEYLLKLFMNMIYVSVKWSDNSWLKSSITIDSNKDNFDDDKQYLLSISVLNGASNEKYLEGLELFHQENSFNQTNNTETNNADSKDNNDRFMVAAIYYMRQICDVLSANICFERNLSDENVLNVKIPVKISSQNSSNIGVPVLKHKTVLLVTPYTAILRSLSEQLTIFGMNVTALSDKYSAIGHIVGKNSDDKGYDLFIIDHNPPDIDSESLTKIIRENSKANLTHIIIITTEACLAQIEKNKSMYDAVFTKPVMPELLREKLEEFIEIQLYGQNSKESSDDELVATNTSKELENQSRFLAIMDEELSTMLLQLVLTKVNYHVDVALSATQLYELIEKHNYNFIFVANKCPWIVPENLSRDIRRHHTDNKDSVLIMIYDSLKEATHKKLIRAGYDDFIPLPLSRSIFMEKIESWNDPITKRMQPTLNNSNELLNEEDENAEIENNLDQDMI